MCLSRDKANIAGAKLSVEEEDKYIGSLTIQRTIIEDKIREAKEVRRRLVIDLDRARWVKTQREKLAWPGMDNVGL